MTTEARDFERLAIRFDLARRPRPQTNKDIWDMMADFGKEQYQAGYQAGLEQAMQFPLATIVSVFQDHETNYYERPDGEGWQWSCKCDTHEKFDDRDRCVHQTQWHWAGCVAAAIRQLKE